MSVISDATFQSRADQNNSNKSSSRMQSPPNKKSHIREHPFMKEVKYH
jgi:hypothetical protein